MKTSREEIRKKRGDFISELVALLDKYDAYIEKDDDFGYYFEIINRQDNGSFTISNIEQVHLESVYKSIKNNNTKQKVMENQDLTKAAEFCSNELLKENESLMLIFNEGLKVRLQEAFIKGYFKGQKDLLNSKVKLY